MNLFLGMDATNSTMETDHRQLFIDRGRAFKENLPEANSGQSRDREGGKDPIEA